MLKAVDALRLGDKMGLGREDGVEGFRGRRVTRSLLQ